MPVFAKTICLTLKPSHMPQHRWVKGLFFLFESQCLWTAVLAKEFLWNFSKAHVAPHGGSVLAVPGAQVEFGGGFPRASGQRFPSTAALTCPTLQHAPVGCVRDGVDVGRHLVPLLSLVHVDNLLWINGQLLVWIYHNTEETWISLQGN